MIKVTGCRILIRPEPVVEDEMVKRAREMNIIIHVTKEKEQLEERQQKIAMDKGTVLQIGGNCHPDYVGDLKVGDLIGFAKFGGKWFQENKDSEELLIINDEDVICIFKED